MTWVFRKLSDIGSRVSQFLHSIVERQIPQREAEKLAPALGYKTLTDFRFDISQVREMEPEWQKIKYIPYNYTIPARWHMVTEWQTRQPFSYRVQVAVVNRETGERDKIWITVESQRPLSREEIAWDAEQAILYGRLREAPYKDYDVEYEKGRPKITEYRAYMRAGS
jgi:hypothetical protein